MTTTAASPTTKDPILGSAHHLYPPTSQDLLSPYGISLVHLLQNYLKNLPIVLAHQLHLPITKARTALRHSITISVLQLMHSPTPPKPNDRLQHQLSTCFTLSHLQKIEPLSVAHDFFGQAEDAISQHIASLDDISPRTAIQILGSVAALTRQYAATIAHAKLEPTEYSTWLQLQALFLDPANPDSPAELETWYTILHTRHTPPNITHQSYHAKLGKSQNTPTFDQSQYAMPNLHWLIKLAMFINKHHSTPLTLGKALPTPSKQLQKNISQGHSNPSLSNQNPSPNLPLYRNARFLIGVALICLTVIALIIWQWQATPTPTISEDKPTPIPQDIAIIRTDEADSTADNAPDNTSDDTADGNVDNSATTPK